MRNSLNGLIDWIVSLFGIILTFILCGIAVVFAIAATIALAILICCLIPVLGFGVLILLILDRVYS